MSTSDDKTPRGRSSITINEPATEHPRPDDFAALPDIHEGGTGSRFSAPAVWGVAAVAFLLGGVATLWWNASRQPPAPVATPASPADALGLMDPRDPANKATLVVSADAPCMLWIGGKPIVKLAPSDAAEVAVMPVEQQIVCQSTSDPKLRGSQIRKLDPRSRVFVNLELAPAPSTGQEAARVTPVSTDLAVGDDTKAKAYQDRWTASGVDALRDSASGLKWTQDDNGADVDWSGAQKFCANLSLGGATGWRLPTADELRGIYDGAGRARAACRVGKCGVSNQFRLSSYAFWTGEANGEREAWTVSLGGGQRASYPTGYSLDTRALCVRSG